MYIVTVGDYVCVQHAIFAPVTTVIDYQM